MAGTARVTKAGAYVERGGAALDVTLAGAYVELSEPQSISVGVTLAGAYVELSSTVVRVSQAGVYVEMHTEAKVTQAGAYVELSIPVRPKPSVHRRPRFYATARALDFHSRHDQPYKLKPIRWSWMRPGGCYRAEIEVHGRQRDVLNNLPSLLRTPVQIRNNNHTKVWNGFVNDIEIYTDELTIGMSLDNLYNSVAIAYTLLDAGESNGISALTTVAFDSDSIARFGTKERIEPYGNATTYQASLVRDRFLQKYRTVLPDTRPGGNKTISGKLICRGWWETLDWRYYANYGTDLVAIDEQIAAIEVAVGEFFAGTDIVTPHTVESNEYRDGYKTAKEIIEELILTPSDDGKNYTAWATLDRYIRLEQEPDPAITDWLLMPDGQFRTFLNGIPDPGVEIIGWTQLRGVLPASDWGYLISPTPLYLEENEFDANTLQYSWRARGARGPWGDTTGITYKRAFGAE